MAVAWLLALLGLAGVAAGLWLGQSRILSSLVAAAAGGLLFGISVFWLVPEIAAESGWMPAWGLTIAACVALALVDEMFLHSRRPSANVALGPILAATAVHSFVDGWSVRALATFRMAGIAAPLGLALHKIPEGLAIGWIARQNVKTHWKAAAAAAGVELLTVVGALLEPYANRSGFAAFGAWWTSGVIAVIAGSFLFLGVHALVPNRKRAAAIVVFAVTFGLVGTASLVHSG
jgi:zinc transporter ZupT